MCSISVSRSAASITLIAMRASLSISSICGRFGRRGSIGLAFLGPRGATLDVADGLDVGSGDRVAVVVLGVFTRRAGVEGHGHAHDLLVRDDEPAHGEPDGVLLV